VELEKPIVLCVAALTKTKRVDLTIHAVAKIKKTSLLVVGDGELKDEILTLGKKLLGKRFKLINLKHEKMPEVYRIADVFTLASEDYYSFEIVLMEAMASGLGVVANNDEIRSNIVGSAGILIDPTDTENYAGAIKRALDKKWGDKPRDQALKYDWNLITDGYETLFGQLLK
jgi:glycosyltransferase involved in cell wall biosynthesis